MSESERRRGYRYNRVLIETARILDPQFADAVVFLSGAQIEMLRNVTQYLNRLETYVTEYNLGYYLAPTVADYDDILEIVADLEETLMGNPNTLWGYFDQWLPQVAEVSTGEANTDAETAVVPAGEIWIAEHFTVYHNAEQTCPVIFSVITEASGYPFLFEAPALPSYDYVYDTVHFTLKEGQFVRFRVANLPTGKTAYLRMLGYKMKVPE